MILVYAPPVLCNLRVDLFVERMREVTEFEWAVEVYLERRRPWLASGSAHEGTITLSHTLVNEMRGDWWCARGPRHRAAFLASVLVHEMAHVVDPRPSRAMTERNIQRGSHGPPFWRRMRNIAGEITGTDMRSEENFDWQAVKSFWNWSGFDAYVEPYQSRVVWP